MFTWKTSCSRWITIFVCFFAMLNAYSMRVCLSIAITEMVIPLNKTKEFSDDSCSENVKETIQKNKTYMQKDLYDWNESTQGMILSSFYWSYIFTNFFGGEIVKIFGGKHTLGVGILSTVILTLLTPVTITWGGSTALTSLRVLMGIGEGIFCPALGAIMAQWIPEHERSKAGSIVFSGISLGTIFGMTGSGIILQNSDVGWPMVFYFYGAVGFLCFVFNCAFCYNKPTENPFISDKEIKYLSENMKSTHDESPPTPWSHILRSKPIWALVALSVGYGWGMLTLITDMPKFMKNVLKFSVENLGYFSSIPYLALWLFSSITSVIADYLIASKRLSINQVRKIGSTVATMGPAIFLIAASHAGCNQILVVALLTIGIALIGCSTFSNAINVLDLAPNHASSITGLVNGIATITGIVAPNVVGILTPNQTLNEWRLVFWIMFVIYSLACLIYLAWGSGELQQWNDSSFLMRKKNISETGVKTNNQILTNT